MNPPYDKAVSREQLVTDLRALGVRSGGVVMVHTSLSQLGWVIGGAETVARALFEVAGPDGTLMAYIGWEDEPPQPDDEVPEATRAMIEAHHPPYDPLVARARKDHGRLPELLRTWPGAVHSGHPEAGIVAIGRRAGEIAHPHPFDYGYGANSPYARLIELGGQVLMLGAPLDTATLIHHAETVADVPNKRLVSLAYPIHNDFGQREWQSMVDVDTSDGCLPYETVIDEPYVEYLAGQALLSGAGTHGVAGYGIAHCFEANLLSAYAIQWIEAHFGNRVEAPA
jgi:aminoglycoside 3-N-acetyltransferase